jgi:dethiobiotin synthetase
VSQPLDQPSLLRTQPRQLVVVAGTGTEVGKTWVTARLAAAARDAGRTVRARKPAQSFEPGDDDAGITDAQVLAAATGEEPTDVCPTRHWYPVPMAPPMAADVLGHPPLLLADLLDRLSWPTDADLVVVETAGGVRSPLAVDADTVDLCRHLGPDHVLLVADAGLGTINAVVLSAAALDAWPLVVVLNRFDPDDDLHRRNRDWLRDRVGLRCVTDVDEAAAALGFGSTGPRPAPRRPGGGADHEVR